MVGGLNLLFFSDWRKAEESPAQATDSSNFIPSALCSNTHTHTVNGPLSSPLFSSVSKSIHTLWRDYSDGSLSSAQWYPFNVSRWQKGGWLQVWFDNERAGFGLQGRITAPKASLILLGTIMLNFSQNNNHDHNSRGEWHISLTIFAHTTWTEWKSLKLELSPYSLEKLQTVRQLDVILNFFSQSSNRFT